VWVIWGVIAVYRSKHLLLCLLPLHLLWLHCVCPDLFNISEIFEYLYFGPDATFEFPLEGVKESGEIEKTTECLISNRHFGNCLKCSHRDYDYMWVQVFTLALTLTLTLVYEPSQNCWKSWHNKVYERKCLWHYEVTYILK